MKFIYPCAQLARRAGLSALLLLAHASVVWSAESSAEGELCFDRNAPPVRRVEACTTIIANSPDNHTLFRAYINRGRTHFYSGKGDMGVSDYTQAISVEPQNPDGYAIRGGARLARNEYDGAISDFGVVLRQVPENEYALNQRASAYHRSNRLDLALADYGVLIRLHPTKAEYYDLRASVYAAKGDWDRARTDLNRALQLDPSYASQFPLRCFKADPIYPIVKRDQLINWPECEK